jgi:subtilisin-like proprotein convertase family protein
MAERAVTPDRGELFRMDRVALHGRLAGVPAGEPAVAAIAGSEIEIPMPDGSTARFMIVETSVMAPELAAQFPEIKTYAGQGIDDPEATARLDLTPAGFHAAIRSPRGAVYVDPAFRGDAEFHVSYFTRDNRHAVDDFRCQVQGRGLDGTALKDEGATSGTAAKILSGGTLRTYRLAVAATGEYTAYHSSPSAPNVAAGQAAIVTAINRINGAYEAELGVRFELVGNNSSLVFTDAGTDPYTNDDGAAMLDENQTTVDAVIGSGSYDIGHVFSTGGGGIASLACVCSASIKARGVTGSGAPTGDSFWIDYVAHEMGHQFGCDHTFNSETGACGGGNRAASEAFEPGSGSTIMAYAGICSPNDLQAHSDAYFHASSLEQVYAFLNGGGGDSCAVTNGTGNTAPVVSAGANYSIPGLTPFVLTATGSDANGDPLTYCWEEMDLGVATDLTSADNGSSPLFRSFSPTNTPIRHFPRLSSVLANTNWNQEKLPTNTITRTLKFRVTARDNRAGGGGVANADMQVNVVAGTGPFKVTSPNTAVSWSGARTVTWNVAGTTGAPINASGVNLHLSTNGGSTFNFLLGTNVPNNGSASVVLPNVSSSQARIKVQGADNIFYDVSDVNFTVSPGTALPLVQSLGTTLMAESCLPTNGAVDPYETVTVNWSLINVGSGPTTNLVGTLLTSNGVYYPGAAQNYGAIPAGGTAVRSFSFAPSAPCGGSVTGLVQLADNATALGTVMQRFTLGAVQTSTSTQTFNNIGTITIRDNLTASPYPSAIAVSGVGTPVTKVTASLKNLSHTYPEDFSVLLVGPGGQGVKLMGACGLGYDLANVTLNFDDAAATGLPGGSQIIAGTYFPTDYAPGDVFSAPAPAGPYGTTLAGLAGTPNGTWNHYVQDFYTGDAGSIANGWSLSFITTSTTTNCCSGTYPQPTITSTTYSSNNVQLVWSTLPGPAYQVQYRTNLTAGTWQNLGSPIPGTGTSLGVTDSVTGGPMRFYRIVVGP